MNRLSLMSRELAHLVWQHKLYVLAPVFVVLLLLVVLALYLGPTAFFTFIYAGL